MNKTRQIVTSRRTQYVGATLLFSEHGNFRSFRIQETQLYSETSDQTRI